MLAIFCLRLACGLIGSLLLFSPKLVNPRFYRTHFLTALGLTAVAAIFSWGVARPALVAVLGCSILLAFFGCLSWSIEKNPRGNLFALQTALGLAACLLLAEGVGRGPEDIEVPAFGSSTWWRWFGDLTSAALLGTATTAMLMGHSYLIAPTMSLTPLLRLLGAMLIAILLRLGLAAVGLWFWTESHSLRNLNDETVLWLPVRWGLGFAGPLVLGWMAWQTAKIRSTQSATGILYVVVILCFLGELTSQLLLGTTGYIL